MQSREGHRTSICTANVSTRSDGQRGGLQLETQPPLVMPESGASSSSFPGGFALVTDTLLTRLKNLWYPTPSPEDPFERLYRRTTSRARRVLDFGAGRGTGLPRYAPGNAQVIGVDVNRHLAENPNLDAKIIFDGCHLPVHSSACDVCVMRWVIEHLETPGLAFAEVARVLKPGGRLIFVTSNLWFYAYLIAAVVPNRFHPAIVRVATGRKQEDTFPTQYRANTRKRLRRLLTQVGFREIRLAGFQHGAAYLEFSLPTFLLGAAYDKLVNRYSTLEGARQTLIGEFVKE